LRQLVPVQADLTIFAAGIVDVENPLGVSAAAGALGAASRVKGGAMQEGAADDIGEGGEPGEKAVDLGLLCLL